MNFKDKHKRAQSRKNIRDADKEIKRKNKLRKENNLNSFIGFFFYSVKYSESHQEYFIKFRKDKVNEAKDWAKTKKEIYPNIKIENIKEAKEAINIFNT